MERSSRQHQRRWNPGQLLRSLDESQLSRSRSVDPSSSSSSSSNGRNLVSRLGMTEISCFPSSRSRRASIDRTNYLAEPQERHRRASHSSRIASDRGKGIHIVNNELATFSSSDDSDEQQVFELALLEHPARAGGAGTSLRSLSCKRKSSTFTRGSSSNSGKAKMEMEGQPLRNERGRNLQRASTFVEEQRPKVSRRSEAGARLSRESGDYEPFTRRPADTRGRGRNYDSRGSTETPLRGVRNDAVHSEQSRYGRRVTSTSREAAASSSTGHSPYSKRNISNCFGSGRRSPSPRPLNVSYERSLRQLASSSSSSGGLLSAALEAASSSSSSTSSSIQQQAGQAASSGDDDVSSPREMVWPASSAASGWDYHRPRLMAEGLAKILLALERVENDEELTHEQLLMLEATVLFGGMGLHDRHSDWRMDVDSMSYEELLALEEKIGDVSTGLNHRSIAHGLQKCRFSTLYSRRGQDEELKCSICQEEYKNGDQLGRVDCGHKFHVACIKQWLGHKNLCPICKATALSSSGH